MAKSINHRIAAIPDAITQRALRALFEYLYDEVSNVLLQSGALAIKAGGSAVVKASAALYACCQGVLVSKTANTDMAALSGTVANGKFNVFCFFIDSAGNLTSSMGTAGASLATIAWPTIPQNQAFIGFVIINPTGTGSFVGGTTALDDATVVPNAVYINTLGAFDPTATYTS